MLLPKFEFHEPKTTAEACEIMAGLGHAARPMAGGTDLMVNMKKGEVSPEHVVSVSGIRELKHMEAAGKVFKIGAGVTVSELAGSDEINQRLGALSAGARALGSPLIRNLATIGGNLGSARPAADLPPSLLAYGARVVLASDSGNRKTDLSDFFIGPGLTELQPQELLTEIHVDLPGPGAGAGYINLGTRKAQDCNMVNVGSYLSLDADGRTVSSARVIMGCVGPTHLSSPSAQKVLVGETVSPDLFERAGRAAMGDARPIDDFRGSAEYKQDMVGVLVQRTLEMALKEARDGNS